MTRIDNDISALMHLSLARNNEQSSFALKLLDQQSSLAQKFDFSALKQGFFDEKIGKKFGLQRELKRLLDIYLMKLKNYDGFTGIARAAYDLLANIIFFYRFSMKSQSNTYSGFSYLKSHILIL